MSAPLILGIAIFTAALFFLLLLFVAALLGLYVFPAEFEDTDKLEDELRKAGM